MTDTLSITRDMSPSDWVLIASTLTLAVAAFLTPLIGDIIKATWFGPEIRIRPLMTQPASHKTKLDVRLSPAQIQRHDAYYARLEVVNHGRSQAQRCEIVVESVAKRDATGAYVLYPRYTPVGLTWGSGHDEFVDINPGRHFYCEFISVPDREAQATLSSVRHYVDPADEPPPTLGAVLATRLSFNSQPNRLPPGEYRIGLALFSENASTQRLTLALSWTGHWKDEEADMFRELVVAKASGAT